MACSRKNFAHLGYVCIFCYTYLQEAIETYILVFVDLPENAASEKPNDEPTLAKIVTATTPLIQAGGWMSTTIVQD